MTNVVLTYEAAALPALRRTLEEMRCAFSEAPHAAFLARGPGVTVTAYRTGKLLVTGRDAELAAERLRAAGARGMAGSAPAPERPRGFIARVGSDESGKGDLFGPLVVAAVAVLDEAAEASLLRAGVRDSKVVPDASIGRMADAVQDACPYEAVVLVPDDYNAAYAEAGNLNVLLARQHEAVIRRLCGRVPARRIVVDRFASSQPLTRALADLALPVEERAGAESDMAVAAASILARRLFLANLAVLGEEMGARLPKGAGPPAATAARAIRSRWGDAGFAHVAKTHFRVR